MEDNAPVAEVATAYFQQLGYMVKQASGAQQALELLGHEPKFDLVFSDILMPGGMNGVQLGHAIRKLYPGMPVLLTTGFSNSARDAVEQGFIVLQKPFGLARLEQALLELQSLRRKPQERAIG